MQAPHTRTAKMAIRAATLDDRDFVIATARRLAAFELPHWRTPNEIVPREQQALIDFFDRPAPGTALFIAGLPGEEPLGYAYLETHEDYFTGHQHAHVSTLAVNERGEGQGVGGALMRAAEEWARSKGFHYLTLNVFEKNSRAREIYEHLGFQVETLHYVKVLDGDDRA